MPQTTVTFAPHVGTYVAATYADGGALLAIALSSGPRGALRVCVFETRTWSMVGSFPIPNRSRSGVTPIDADGRLLLANDDHTLAAFELPAGRLAWERSFPAPSTVRLLATKHGRALVSTTSEVSGVQTRLLRTADGSDEALLAVAISRDLQAHDLGADGTVVAAWMRFVDIARDGEPPRRLPLETRRFGTADAVALDQTGTRLLIGTRTGEALLMDLASGTARTLLELPDGIRSVGFDRGAPWILDCAGRLRILADESAPTSVDLGLSTYGGILADDGSAIALGDLDTRTFRVRRLPGNEEVFATNPGFVCVAVAIGPDGALFVSSTTSVLRLDADGSKPRKLGAGASDLLRLEDGSIALVGGSVRVLAPGAAKPAPLSRAVEEVAFVGQRMFAIKGEVAEMWDLAKAKRTWRLDLSRTWVGETNEALRLLHLGPDGRPWIHLTDGSVHRADALDDPDGHVGRLSPDGSLWVHPDGQSLYWVHDSAVRMIAVDGLRELGALDLAIDAEVSRLHFSPSGKRLVAFHRNGRLSAVDLPSGRAVAIDSPETSAAERAPNELYIVDLQTPMACAFGRDEESIAWTQDGGIVFASLETGRITGRLVVATSGRDYVVTDGAAFDWPTAAAKGPLASELLAVEGDRSLATSELLARREARLIGSLTR